MNKLKIMMIAILAAAMGACCSQKQAQQDETTAVVLTPGAPLTGMNPNYLPKAVIYKTNGDYINNVAVNMNADRTQIVSYPAPSDVSAESAALPIANGWLLDRRGGVGTNTAFLKYTYEEYSQLPIVPSMDELMQSIIPDARVTEVKALPITQSAALADPAMLKQYAE